MFCVAPYSPNSENKKCPPIQNFGGVQEVSGNSLLGEQSFRRTPSHFITSNIPTSQNSCQLSISPPSGFSAIKMALQSVQSPSKQGKMDKMESLKDELNNESLPSSQHEIPSPSSKSSNRSSKSARSDFLNFVDDLLSPMEVDSSPVNSLSSPHAQVMISSSMIWQDNGQSITLPYGYVRTKNRILRPSSRPSSVASQSDEKIQNISNCESSKRTRSMPEPKGTMRIKPSSSSMTTSDQTLNNVESIKNDNSTSVINNTCDSTNDSSGGISAQVSALEVQPALLMKNKIALAKRLQGAGWGSSDLPDPDLDRSIEGVPNDVIDSSIATSSGIGSGTGTDASHELVDDEDVLLGAHLRKHTLPCEREGEGEKGGKELAAVSFDSDLASVPVQTSDGVSSPSKAYCSVVGTKLPFSPSTKKIVKDATPVKPPIKSGMTSSTPNKHGASAFTPLAPSPSRLHGVMISEPSPLKSNTASSAFHSPRPSPSVVTSRPSSFSTPRPSPLTSSTRAKESLSGAAHPRSFYTAPPRIVEVSPSARSIADVVPQLTAASLDAPLHRMFDTTSSTIVHNTVSDDLLTEHIITSDSQYVSCKSTTIMTDNNDHDVKNNSSNVRLVEVRAITTAKSSHAKAAPKLSDRRSPAAEAFASFVVSTVRSLSPAPPSEPTTKSTPTSANRASYGLLKPRSQSPMPLSNNIQDEHSTLRDMSPFELAVEQFRKAHNLTPQTESPLNDHLFVEGNDRDRAGQFGTNRFNVGYEYGSTTTKDLVTSRRKRSFDGGQEEKCDMNANEADSLDMITKNKKLKEGGTLSDLYQNHSHVRRDVHHEVLRDDRSQYHNDLNTSKTISVSRPYGKSVITNETMNDANQYHDSQTRLNLRYSQDMSNQDDSHDHRRQQPSSCSSDYVTTYQSNDDIDRDQQQEDEYLTMYKTITAQPKSGRGGAVVTPATDMNRSTQRSASSQSQISSEGKSVPLSSNQQTSSHSFVKDEIVEDPNAMEYGWPTDRYRVLTGDDTDNLFPSGGRPTTDQKKDLKRSVKGSTKSTACTCRKTRCLKLYCDCFSSRTYCQGCFCSDCANTPELEPERELAVKAICERNPSAFSAQRNDPFPEKSLECVTRPELQQRSKHQSNQQTHLSPAMLVSKAPLAPKAPSTTASFLGGKSLGCNCRKSACLKKYCECFQAESACTTDCHCFGCQNNVELQESRKNIVIEWRMRAS